MNKSEYDFYIKIVFKKIAENKKKIRNIIKKKKREKDNIYLNNDHPGEVTKNDSYIRGTFPHPVYNSDEFNFTNIILQ